MTTTPPDDLSVRLRAMRSSGKRIRTCLEAADRIEQQAEALRKVRASVIEECALAIEGHGLRSYGHHYAKAIRALSPEPRYVIPADARREISHFSKQMPCCRAISPYAVYCLCRAAGLPIEPELQKAANDGKWEDER